jgi:tetraacyldisaccharide 4'-kinase
MKKTLNKNNYNIEKLYKKIIFQKSNFNIFNILFLLLSFFYTILLTLRELFYKLGIFKTYEFKKSFIISIGNITTGGTGKTPIVMKIIDIIKKKYNSKNIAVVSRGYKRKNKDIQIKLKSNEKANLSLNEIGDEPSMILNKYPNIYLGIGANRPKVIEKLLSTSTDKIDYIILDDGFQKISIKKNLNIMLIDLTSNFLFFKDFVIPRGTLREPIKNIKNADLIILTKTNLAETKNIDSTIKNLKKFGFSKEYKNLIISQYIPSYFSNLDNEFIKLENINDLSNFKNSKINILTGIGNPNSFINTVKKLEIEISKTFIFQDHCWFKIEDIEKSLQNCDFILTTEKDFVKIKEILKNSKNISINKNKILCLNMDVIFDNENFINI